MLAQKTKMHSCLESKIILEDCHHEFSCPCKVEKTCPTCSTKITSIIQEENATKKQHILDFKFRSIRFKLGKENNITEEKFLSSLFTLNSKRMILLVNGERFSPGKFKDGFEKGISSKKVVSLIATPKSEHEQITEIETQIYRENWKNFIKNTVFTLKNGIGNVFSNLFLFLRSIFVPPNQLIEDNDETHEHEE
jgi:hypothetical protein